MDKHVILFDLDGTLTDPKEGITKSVQHALEYYGIREDDLDKLEPFIGPPLVDSFQEFYNFSEEDAKAAVPKFQEYFKVKGMFENEPYEGIHECLQALCDEGIILAVATSKPEVFAEKILEHFDLRRYFTAVGGADIEETRVRKDEIIAYTLKEKLGVSKEEADIIMVGDRKHDTMGAHANGIESVGVLYGYGDVEEFMEAETEFIVCTVEELKGFLLNWAKPEEPEENMPVNPFEELFFGFF